MEQNLVLVGGLPGSGKTEVARLLGKATAWKTYDKDAVTRTLAETMLVEHGSNPNDRESDFYVEKVRPAEYRSLMHQGSLALESGESVILDAPFIREVTDDAWTHLIVEYCRERNIKLWVVWVQCDMVTTKMRLQARGAGRDLWKLANWDAWMLMVSETMKPVVAFDLIDNSHDGLVNLTHQVTRLARRMTGKSPLSGSGGATGALDDNR